MTQNKKLSIMMMIFITATLASNIMAAKLVTLGPISVPAGVVVFPMSFVVTDIVNEVYGKAKAAHIVRMGFLASAIFTVFIGISVILPAASFWDMQEAYAAILASVPRITIGGLVAFFVSQNTDIIIFDMFKKVHGQKLLWLRKTVSTVTSQLLDSLIFITIAFYGAMTMKQIVIMAFSQWAIKFIFALIDTPFVYWGVSWARKGATADELQ